MCRAMWHTMFDEVNDRSILKKGASLAINDLFTGDSTQDEPVAATIAKRFSALVPSPPLALHSDLLDLQIGEGLRLDRELVGKAIAFGLPSFVLRGAKLGGCSEGCRLGIDGCGGPWRAGARRLRRSSYMRPISSSVTGRPLQQRASRNGK